MGISLSGMPVRNVVRSAGYCLCKTNPQVKDVIVVLLKRRGRGLPQGALYAVWNFMQNHRYLKSRNIVQENVRGLDREIESFLSVNNAVRNMSDLYHKLNGVEAVFAVWYVRANGELRTKLERIALVGKVGLALKTTVYGIVKHGLIGARLYLNVIIIPVRIAAKEVARGTRSNFTLTTLNHLPTTQVYDSLSITGLHFARTATGDIQHGNI